MIRKIGTYKIIKEISEGGMAVVYLATHKSTGKMVAIKLLKERLIDKEKIAQRFSQEGLLKLDHPHIVKVHSVGSHNSTPYIVMDYVEGTDLEEFIKKRGKLSLDKALNIFNQILSALSYVHKKGIIHRDIKPKNILINKDGVAKLTDFGIAKSLYSHIKTSTGGYLGAPAYSSPEQMDGKKVDARSDIYSLGITLYEMLAGRVPFSSTSFDVIVKEKFSDSMVPITKYRSDIPDYIIFIIKKCAAKNPENRYKSVNEIYRETGRQREIDETIVKAQSVKNIDKKYERAFKRVKRIKGFYKHLIIYICINLALIIINITTSPRVLWFYWLLILWGIGLFFHGMSVFVFSKFYKKKWEEKKIEEIMKKMYKD